MRKLMRRLGVVLVAGVGLAGILPAVGALAASGGTLLPISGFEQMVADTPASHLFFSEGGNGGIAVTDLSGSLVTTIVNTTGATGMALSSDGSTLYAALDGSGEVVAISTTSLEVTATYSLPAGDQPEYVAVQSGLVWISYNDGTAGAIGEVDPSASSPAFTAETSMGTWYSAPRLAADPSDDGVLVAGQPNDSAGEVATFNTATSPVTTLAPAAAPSDCGFVNSMAVTAGGADVVIACSGDAAEVYSTTNLSADGSYLADGGPDETGTNAVAIDAAGDVAVGTGTIGGTGTDLSGPDLYTYAAGSTTAANALTLNSVYSSSVLTDDGVAWVGSAVYAVVFYNAGVGTNPSQYYLQVIDQPLVTQTSLTLSAPSSVYLGKSVAITGTLSLSTGAPPVGTAVTITRTEQGSTASHIFTVTTSASGSFSLTDVPPGPGTFTYTASYAGTQGIAAASAARTVTVKKLVPSLSLSTAHTTYSYKPTVKVTAHLGPTYTLRTVAIYARDLSGTKTVLIRRARVDSKGYLTVSYRAPHNTTFTAVFAGDARYAERSVSRTIDVHAAVSQHVTGEYGSEHRSGHLYYLFRENKTLYSKLTVQPNQRGQCVEFELQVYYDGVWSGANTGCGRLSKSSTILLKLSLRGGGIGLPYRLRGEFLPARSDHANLGADTPWAYFLIE
jgi:Carboxypeptidase regulatory-like domain